MQSATTWKLKSNVGTHCCSMCNFLLFNGHFFALLEYDCGNFCIDKIFLNRQVHYKKKTFHQQLPGSEMIFLVATNAKQSWSSANVQSLKAHLIWRTLSLQANALDSLVNSYVIQNLLTTDWQRFYEWVEELYHWPS